MKSSRRDFIQKGLVVSAGLPLISNLGFRGNEKSTTDELSNAVFILENGQLFKDDVSMISGLYISDNGYSAVRSKLQEYKDDHNYRSRITYRSSDRYKKPCAKAWIRYFERRAEIQFVGVVVRRENLQSEINLLRDSRKEREKLKSKVYKKLLRKVDNIGTVSNVLVKSQSVFGPSRRFKEKFDQDNDGVSYGAYDTIDEIILQLGDLIAGNVFASLTGVSTNKVKKNITEYFLERLNIQQVQDNTRLNDKLKMYTY